MKFFSCFLARPEEERAPRGARPARRGRAGGGAGRAPLLSGLLSGRQDPTYTSPHATRIAHTLAKRLFVHALRTTLHVRRAFARRERSAFEKNLYTRLRSVHVLWLTIYG